MKGETISAKNQNKDKIKMKITAIKISNSSTVLI